MVLYMAIVVYAPALALEQVSLYIWEYFCDIHRWINVMKIAKKYNPQSELDEDFQVKKNLQQAVEFLDMGWGMKQSLAGVRRS
jgi:hypothetical protein